MKKLEELVNGDCIVIAEYKGTVKEFKGIYNENLKIVFMTIPRRYNIMGYKQV